MFVFPMYFCADSKVFATFALIEYILLNNTNNYGK